MKPKGITRQPANRRTANRRTGEPATGEPANRRECRPADELRPANREPRTANREPRTLGHPPAKTIREPSTGAFCWPKPLGLIMSVMLTNVWRVGRDWWLAAWSARSAQLLVRCPLSRSVSPLVRWSVVRGPRSSASPRRVRSPLVRARSSGIPGVWDPRLPAGLASRDGWFGFDRPGSRCWARSHGSGGFRLSEARRARVGRKWLPGCSGSRRYWLRGSTDPGHGLRSLTRASAGPATASTTVRPASR